MSVTEYNLGKVGVTPKGAYDDGATYERLDVVTHAGGSYLSLIDDNTEPLSDDTAWQLLAEKGDSGAKGDRPDHEWDGTEIQFEKPDGSMGEKVDLQGKEGEPGKPGKDGDPGAPGTDGKGWTGGSYDDETGVVTFISTDGLGFYTDDLRGADGVSPSLTPIASYTETLVTLHGNGLVTIDLDDGNVFYHYIGYNIVSYEIDNAKSGAHSFTLVILLSTGSVTWPENVYWRDGEEPDLAAGLYVLTFFTIDGGVEWYGMPAGRFK